MPVSERVRRFRFSALRVRIPDWFSVPALSLLAWMVVSPPSPLLAVDVMVRLFSAVMFEANELVDDLFSKFFCLMLVNWLSMN